jgi:hypothetical protein
MLRSQFSAIFDSFRRKKFSFVLSQKRQLFCYFFGENIFKNHNIGPWALFRAKRFIALGSTRSWRNLNANKKSLDLERWRWPFKSESFVFSQDVLLHKYKKVFFTRIKKLICYKDYSSLLRLSWKKDSCTWTFASRLQLHTYVCM